MVNVKKYLVFLAFFSLNICFSNNISINNTSNLLDIQGLITNQFITPLLSFLIGVCIAPLIQYILDNILKELRFDKKILSFVIVSGIYGNLKLSFNSNENINLKEIQTKLNSLFKSKFIKNELKKTSLTIQIKETPLPIKISLIQPSINKLYTLVLETLGQEKITMFGQPMKNTLELIEEIKNNLNMSFNKINLNIRIRYRINNRDKKNIVYTYKENIITPENISINTNEFTKIKSLIKDCFYQWQVTFI